MWHVQGTAQPAKRYEIRPCDVCRLTGGPGTPQPVLYCHLCDSWICDDCRPRYTLRVIAAFKAAAQWSN